MGRYSFIHQSRLSLPIVEMVTQKTATPNISDLPEPDKLRALAGEIRQHTLDHLDDYLSRMQESVTRNGGQFHLADTTKSAKKYLVDVLAKERCEHVCREPSVLCDEIGFTTAGSGAADALVTGANFAIAETGQVCICRNDDSSRMELPRVVVVVLGIESILPRLSDLAVMLKLLNRSAIGRPMTPRTEILGAGSSTIFDVIFVDNGRRKILGGEHRPVLRCIGCGACSAVCPVYQELRRENAVATASPIGAILSPLLKGISAFDELPFASTLCGACSAACPVGIDLPWHLARLREQLVRGRHTGFRDRLLHRLRAWTMGSSSRFKKLGSPGWKLGIPSEPAAPAAKSFRELWKERSR
jgi:L-lactate dehydrogenase complex protein LldF